MALCVLLALIAVQALCANGFGFSVAPFQMELQLPAGGPGPSFGPFGGPSPLMSMMSFPPIFNPMEAMGREEMDADARMDVNGGPVGNVTTKNKTESKDGFKVTTITSDGPGFHSYIKEYEKEGNSSSSGGNSSAPSGPPPDIGKLLSSGKIFDIMNQLRNMGKRPQKCKKCGSGKFCDPIFHLCRKKFAEGRTCMAQKQCGANLRCQWGKCQKAKRGDPGTFCKGNNQCNGDSCCRNTPGSFHLMCIPPQNEGAICGLHQRQESVAKLFYVVKRSTVPTCSPCKSGLKCANTGGSRFKHCAKDSYVEKAAEELEDDNPSNAITEDDDDDNKDKDGGSGNDNDDGPPHPLKDPNVPDREDKQVEEEEEEKKRKKKKEKEEKEEKEKEEKDDDDDDKKDDEDDKKDDEDDKEEAKEEKDDEEKEDEKETPKDEENGEDKEEKDDEEEKDDDKEKENSKDVSKEDKKDDKDDKKKPIQNGEGMEIVVPKKKKKKGKAGKGKGKGKKD